MPLVNEEVRFKNNQSTDAFNQSFKSNQSNNFNQTNQAETSPKGLFTLPPALMQIIPWIPFALEAISGQKIPAMGGTIGEIQSSLQQIQFSLTQLLSNQQQMLSGQQQLWTKLESLESNASNQLTNLREQLANTNNNFRLIAQETKRSLEFNHQPKELES